jgi:hypothetical protein
MLQTLYLILEASSAYSIYSLLMIESVAMTAVSHDRNSTLYRLNY